MLRFLFIFSTLVLVTIQCEEPKRNQNLEKEIPIKSYDNALDVPLKRTGVVIKIDSITFFDQNQLTTDKTVSTKKVINSITSLNQKINLETTIAKKVSSILKNRNVNFTLIDDFNFNSIPQDLITKQNIKNVDFKSIQEKYKFDDIIILSMKNGFDYNQDNFSNKNQYVAKTFLAVNIIDLDKKQLKFAENIGGVRFLDQSVDSINSNHLENIMGKSINETIEIIEKKY